MTVGMMAARIGAGLLLGSLAIGVPWASEDLSHFSFLICLLALPVAGAVAAVNVLINGRHFKWWRSCHDEGVVRYILMNALTGAIFVAVAAYPGMLLGILGFSAP